MPDDMRAAFENIDDLRVRQQSAWQRGERLLVELLVVSSSPNLTDSDWLELIYAEVVLRGERGEDCQADEYVLRFPQFKAALERLFALHQALETPEPSQVGQSTVDWQQVRQVAHAASQAVGQINRGMPQALNPASPRQATTTDPRRFRVLRPHAQGGIGEVFLAFDEELHREVALKEIQSRHVQDASFRERFVREAEVTGGLEHPGIVPVYSLGHHGDGRPFYAMRFIRGDSLLQAIDRFHAESMIDEPQAIPQRVAPPPAAADASTIIGEDTSQGQPTVIPEIKQTDGHKRGSYAARTSRDKFQSVEFRKLLGRFIDVCQAIEYAHSRGVLHRDLKPANIMLGKYGETLVVDWGLAKAVGQDERFANTDEATYVPSSGSSIEQTADGSLIGTLAYMSPEQAAGRIQELGPPADVYSLGATLYQILTGRLRFQSLPRPELLRRIQAGEFPRPREINVSIAKPLEAICLKALALQPTERYESATAIAEDIEHWLADEPVNACRETIVIQASRWVRKHRAWALSGTAALALVAVVATVAAFWINGQKDVIAQQERTATRLSNRNAALAEEKTKLAAQEKSAREKAELNAESARRQTRLAMQRLYISQMKSVQDAWEKGRVGLMRELLDQWKVPIESPIRFPVVGENQTKARSPLAVSEDLRGFEWYYWNRLTRLFLLDFQGHSNWVTSVAFSPDGKRLASASADQTVKVWDTTSGQAMLTLNGHVGGLNSVAFSPDGKRLASASYDQTVKVWDAASGQELRTLKGHTGDIKSVAFSPDGKRLASASSDQTVKVWDATSGQVILTIKGHHSWVNSVAFSPDGQRLASASDQTLKLWDATSGQELLTFRGHSLGVNSLVFSPSGKWLASAGHDSTARVWDASSGQAMLMLRGHTSSVYSVAFSPDGQRLASTSGDQTIKVWNAISGEHIVTLKGHAESVFSVAFSPDGRCLASASSDQTVKVWDATISQEARTLMGHTGGINSIAFSADGNRLASASADQTVKVWNAMSGQEILTLKGHVGEVNNVVFSPDGNRLASASNDSTVKVWDARSGNVILTLKGHNLWGNTGGINSVAFSPDGKWLASADGDEYKPNSPAGVIKVWDATSGRVMLNLNWHNPWNNSMAYSSVAYSPDGKQLAASTRGRVCTVKVWNATTGENMVTLTGHTQSVFSVAFSPNGKFLATASLDETAKVWDASSGQVMLTIKGHNGWINCVAFSPDGRRLASASADDTVKLWDNTSGQETLTLKGHTDSVSSVAFSPDGQRLASASLDQTVKVWDAPHRLHLADSLPDLAFWHGRQSKEAELKNHWFAARFHLKRLLELTPASDKREQAALNFRLSNASLRLGEKLDAQEYLSKAMAINEQRISDKPDDLQAQYELSESCYRTGELLIGFGKTIEAIPYYLRHQKSLEQGSEKEPENLGIQRSLASSYDRVGSLFRQVNQAEQALDQFQKLRAISQITAQAKASVIDDHLRWNYSHERIGDALLQLGRTQEAEEYFQKNLDLAQKLSDEHTDTIQCQFNLSVALLRTGDMQVRQARISEGMKDYQRALIICRKLVDALPFDAQAHRYLNVAYTRLCELERERFHFTEARHHFADLLSVLEAFAARTKLTVFDKEIGDLKLCVAHCETSARVIVDLEFAVGQDKATVPRWLLLRVQAMLAYAGSAQDDIPVEVREKWSTGSLPAALLGEAIRTADTYRSVEPATDGDLYDAGCCFSLCLKGLAKLDIPDKDRLRGELQSKALEALRASITAGWKDGDHMAKDADLEPLREMPEFQMLLEQLRSKP